MSEIKTTRLHVDILETTNERLNNYLQLNPLVKKSKVVDDALTHHLNNIEETDK